MLDKRTTKASLLKKEMTNAKRMLRELVRMRYRKLVKVVTNGNKVPPNVLTIEEEKLFANVQPFADAFESFARGILHGYLPTFSSEKKHKRATLRFMKDVPAIIGADMKTYGPFKVEDVASLPFENVKILVKQGLAEKVEV
jgi:DNA replication factor GINS